MKSKISRKQHLLNRLEQAKIDYPEYSDMFEDIRLEVENRYPAFNSRSTWELTCSVCGTTRELMIFQLYNGKGLDMCQTCNVLMTAATAAHTSESQHKAALTKLQNGSLQSNLAAAHTYESRSKAWQTRKSH